MENREILIANTKTQTRSKITTDATTLGELKAALDAADIDYRDMTFTEGISKTQLLDDATQLPQNLMYKGKATNNLVILLTNTKKKISSGIYAGDRKACYSIIKEQNLQEDVKEHFGRNFTQVPTADLQKFIEERTESSSYCGDVCKNDCNDEEVNMMEEDNESKGEAVTEGIINLIKILAKTETIGYSELMHIVNAVNGITHDMKEKYDKESTESVSTSDGSIDDDDIDNMLNDLSL